MTGTRVCIFAGGTGGHVFPALAVADRLREDGWAVSWVGTRRGIEARVVPGARLPLHFISTRRFRGARPRGSVRGDGGGARAGGRDPAPHPPRPRPRHGRVRFGPGRGRGVAAPPSPAHPRAERDPGSRQPGARPHRDGSHGELLRHLHPPWERVAPHHREPGAGRVLLPSSAGRAPCRSGAALRVLVLGGSQGAERLSTGPCRRRPPAWSGRSRSVTRRAKAGRPRPPGSATARRGSKRR